MSLNPLATPKGVKLLCERCQKPAYVQCTGCRVTYYCGDAHQKEGWEAIHQRICPVVAVLRAPQPHASSSEEREHRREQQLLRKKHIIDVALSEGRRFLHEGQPNLAIPAALEALKFLTEIHGPAHIELTPAYLVLAEAAIGLGRLSEADQYLSQAQWSVLKAKESEAWLRARLHRNLGLLAAAKGKTEEARRHFAEDIYQSSVAYSPHAIEAAGGYYHLGHVFLQESRPDIAASLHDQVITIWRQHLQALVPSVLEATTSPRRQKETTGFLLPSDKPTGPPARPLDSMHQAEAGHMLHSILKFREQHSHSAPYNMVPLYHTLSLLYCTMRDTEKCEAYARGTLELLGDSGGHGDSSMVETKESIETMLQIVGQTP